MEPTLSPALSDLTPKQRNFVLAYLSNNGNGTAAARTAGYKGTEGSLAVTASRLLTNAKVSRALAEQAAPVLRRKVLDAEQVLTRLSEEATDKDNFPPNRTKALDLLGRYLGLNRDSLQTDLLRLQVEERKVLLEERRLAIEERRLALEKARRELQDLKDKEAGVSKTVFLEWSDAPEEEAP